MNLIEPEYTTEDLGYNKHLTKEDPSRGETPLLHTKVGGSNFGTNINGQASTSDLGDNQVTSPKENIAAKVADCIVASSGGDYTSIQDALDAGNENIFVSKGTYLLRKTITITKSNVTIIGESETNTILKIPSIVIDNCDSAWDESVDSDVTVEADTSDYQEGNASLKITVDSGASAGDMLVTQSVDHLDLSDLDKMSFWMKSSISLNFMDLDLLLSDEPNCQNVVQRVALIPSSIDTWELEEKSGYESKTDLGDIVSIGIQQNVDLGAFVFYLDDFRMCDNDDLIKVGDGTNSYEKISIRNIQLDGNKDQITSGWASSGIYFYGNISKSSVTNCYVHDFTDTPIELTDGSENNIITQNRLDNGNSAALMIHSSDNNVITNNICANGGTLGGIYIYGSSYCIVTGNKVLSNGGSGIDDDAGKNIIIGNRVISNNTNGIEAGGRDTVIGNQCNNNTENGINVSSNCTVEGNICSGNGGHGISDTVYDNCLINGNRCTNNSGYGIRINDIADNIIVTGNNLVGNTTGALHDEGGENMIITDNLGYNPVGTSSIPVGSSPFEHTAGPSSETIYIRGGTVSLVETGTPVVTVFESTGHSVELGPNDMLRVTFSGTPTMIKDIH